MNAIPTVTVETVSPAIASKWLEQNTNNRKLRKTLAGTYARDMEAGLWQLAGDPLRFADDGTLVDGQHRLQAVIQSGSTLPFVVIRGVGKEAQAVMDIGGKRNAADALRLRGTDGDVKDIASIARSVLMYDQGLRPTSPQIVQYAEDNHDELVWASSIGRPVTAMGIRGGTLFGAASMLLGRVNHGAVEEFMDKLATGEELQKGSPILLLRNRFIQGMPATSRDASSLRHNLGWIFKAWNHWRDDRTLKLLRFSSSDAFPMPR